MRTVSNLQINLLFGGVVSKINESPSDSQDNWAYNQRIKRYAIADGVGQSFFPAEWSKLVVEHFCDDKDTLSTSLFESNDWKAWLTPIQQQWQAQIQHLVSKTTGSDTAHLRNSLAEKDPAATTFVGLQIDAGNNPNWQALIVGDSCLFHVRDDVLESYLIKTPSEFSNHPENFTSYSNNRNYEPKLVRGTIKNGDIFLLATDALSKWILTKYQLGGTNWQSAWSKLIAVSKYRELYDFVNEARSDNQCRLEDDDVTLMIISVIERAGSFREFIEPPINLEKPKVTQTVHGGTVSQIDVHQQAKLNSQSINATRKISRIPKIVVIISIIALISLALNVLQFFNKDFLSAAFSPDVTKLLSLSTNVTELKSGSLLYPSADNNTSFFLSVETESSALLLGTFVIGNQHWDHVQIDLLVLSSFSGQTYLIQDENVIVLNTMNAYSADPNTTGTIIGQLSKGSIFPKIGGFSNSDNIEWYKIRASGFVLKE
jgi:serine/threonine protein phosphatase PrpC